MVIDLESDKRAEFNNSFSLKFDAKPLTFFQFKFFKYMFTTLKRSIDYRLTKNLGPKLRKGSEF